LRAGLGFSDAELVSLALLDGVIAVDADRGLVTVQAGARVSQVRGCSIIMRLRVVIRVGSYIRGSLGVPEGFLRGS
jgi:hypothetical protein